MMRALLVLAICLASVSAIPATGRIAGGSSVAISRYPFAASLLYSRIGAGVFSQACGGSIITNKVVLTSAYCMYREPLNFWRVQVGSSRGSSGGVIHTLSRTVVNPNYNVLTADSDIALIYVTTQFSFNTNVLAGTIAGANYNLADNQAVFAIGWGLVTPNGLPSDQLLQTQIWTVNRLTCRSRYSELGYTITDNMLCAGWLDIGGRGQCVGDYGSPLLHGSVIVGVHSWSQQCGVARYPSVNTFIPRFTNWIVANAY